MDSFLIALQFLTRIPVGYNALPSAEQLGRSVLFYPAVGLLLGILLATLASLLPGTSALLQATLVLTVWVLSTGGLHLDGLADCADAWVGGYGDRERSLRIMKDPASGPIAVSVLVLVLLLKFAALAALLTQDRFAPLVITPLLGRSAILMLMLSTDYVRPQGLAETLLQHLPVSAARWLVAACVLLALAIAGLPALAAAGLLLLWLRHAAIARLGGATGDVYGAAVELVETTVLVTVAL